eukprot:423906-Alexandrium_andersonii.AAC.1
MLDGVQSTRAHPTARGPPSQQAPVKVRVDVRAESGPFVLPRKMADAPRACDQVPDQPDQRCPFRGSGGRHPPAALLSCQPQIRAIQAKAVCPCRQRPKIPACSG